MTSILLLTAVGAVFVLFRAATATHDLVIRPETVDPFDATGTQDPADDTLCGLEGEKTQPPSDSKWQVRVFRSLADVELALDRLENCGVAHREVHALGNDVFAVRWC